jgi:predicted PurR-regulated permease PerM
MTQAEEAMISDDGQENPPAKSSGRIGAGRAIILALIIAAVALLVWALGHVLLLIFAGIVVAAVLDAGVRYNPLPVARPWKLALLVLVLSAGVGFGAYWGGTTVVSEFRALEEAVVDQVAQLENAVENLDLPFQLLEDSEQIEAMVPDNEAVVGFAGDAFWTVSGVAINAFTVFLLGIFLAISPSSYRRGIVVLIPPSRRERTAEVLTETGKTLQMWLLGQLAAMALVGVSVFALLWLLDVPNALALAVVTALFNFIPFLGPVLAAIPVGLVALMQGNTTFLVVMGGFLVIQWFEGYLVTPLIQQRAVDLPPAHSLAFLMVMGAMFGELGVALATPLLAVIRVLVLRLYVEDVWGRDAAAG